MFFEKGATVEDEASRLGILRWE